MVVNVTEISSGSSLFNSAQKTRSVLYLILGSWAVVLIARLIPVGGEWLPIDSVTRNAILIWPQVMSEIGYRG